MPFQNLVNALSLTSEQIVKGNTILGVEGTAETGSTNIEDTTEYPELLELANQILGGAE